MRSLIVVFPGCAYAEIAPAVTLLASHATLFVASPEGAAVRTSEGLTIGSDGSFADASALDAAAVVVPGGDLEGALASGDALDALLRAQRAKGAAIGGICNGALLLAKAGVLDGRRATHTAVERHAPRPRFDTLLAFAAPLIARVTYVDRDVVIDDRVVTAKPWAAISFAEALARESGVAPEEAGRSAAYLRGDRLGPDGALARWVVTLRPRDGVPRDESLIAAHVAYLRALDREGVLVSAGPLADGSGGLVVLRAASRDEACSLAAEDPFVARGARTAEVVEWTISCEANRHLGFATD